MADKISRLWHEVSQDNQRGNRVSEARRDASAAAKQIAKLRRAIMS